METVREQWHELEAALGPAAAAAVTRLVSDPRGPGAGAAVQLRPLRRAARVCRVRAATSSGVRSVIVKRLRLDAARRSSLATGRWLPAIGLPDLPPALLGTVAAPEAGWVWHVYEDVGERTLSAQPSDRAGAAAAARLLAELHARGASHPLVGECRRDGEDFGVPYFERNVFDARRLLESCTGRAMRFTPGQAAVRDGLRDRLDALLAEAPRRVRLTADAGGPDTMLHGDPWTSNIVVTGNGPQPRVRVIDWDRAGAGPSAYDLSTFLLRFPAAARDGVLAAYGEAAAAAGCPLAPRHALNLLFDTAERARYANRIIECVIALEDGAGWAHDTLAEVLQWFETLRPVLPD